VYLILYSPWFLWMTNCMVEVVNFLRQMLTYINWMSRYTSLCNYNTHWSTRLVIVTPCSIINLLNIFQHFIEIWLWYFQMQKELCAASAFRISYSLCWNISVLAYIAVIFRVNEAKGGRRSSSCRWKWMCAKMEQLAVNVRFEVLMIVNFTIFWDVMSGRSLPVFQKNLLSAYWRWNTQHYIQEDSNL
jgi:hypothetical protein